MKTKTQKPNSKRSIKIVKKGKSFPKHISEVPMDRGMLFGVRDELKSYINSQIFDVRAEIHQVRAELHEVKAEIHEVRAEIHSVKSEVEGLKSEIQGLKSEMSKFHAKIDAVQSEVHRMAILMEEQNARNGIVMDHMITLFGRQDRVETEVAELRQIIMTGR